MAQQYDLECRYPFGSLLSAAAKMAYSLPDNDRDSAFGDDDFFWADPMFTSLSAPLAGSKRDADQVTPSDAQSGAPERAAQKEHRAEHIDPQVLTCRTCEDAACHETGSDSRPSKRRASALKVGEYHNVAGEQGSSKPNTGQQFPDTCFEQFCQGCDWDALCTSPCPLPCPGETQCSPEDACWDPHCDEGECADLCVDPECTKTSDTDDSCFCQKCEAQPCPLGDPNSECHIAHSGPTAAGTIFCYDNAPCHFQEGQHGYHPTLSAYESYPCFSQSHGASAHCPSTTQASSAPTPVLSPGNYTSLESAFSSHPSPAPGWRNASPCFLNIASEHCHIDNSCCHGDSRACGDCPTAPQEHLDLWNASMASGNGLAGSFMNFGLQQSQDSRTLSMASSGTNATILDSNLHNPMLGFNDFSWMLPESHYSSAFQSSVPENSKLDFLASAIQDDILKTPAARTNTPHLDASSGFGNSTTARTPADPSQSSVCKWQHSPGVLCLAVFGCAEDLHKHVKSAHVDNCTRCFCQWDGCDASSKDFKQRSKLSRHLLGHAGYRPYACSFEGCGKTFATNQAKDNHERTHTGDRPYVCDRCGYTTTTHTQLQTHISALHEGKKPHKCRFCDFSCADSSNLSKHERTHQVSQLSQSAILFRVNADSGRRRFVLTAAHIPTAPSNRTAAGRT